MHLDEYYNEVRIALDKKRYIIKSVNIDFDKSILIDQGILKGKIIFLNNSILHFNEFVSLKKKRYRFHYMEPNNEIIFRYDSSPHHKDISTFPYHMHTKCGIKPSDAVELVEVLNKIEKFVLESFKKQ
ncbi:MAG: toxin-antitoxin system TumE family protein [Candidatus Anammoxibacter sp.]